MCLITTKSSVQSKLLPVEIILRRLDTLTTMKLFVDEAASRTLLPRVDRQVVGAKLGALMLAWTLRIKMEPKQFLIFH